VIIKPIIKTRIKKNKSKISKVSSIEKYEKKKSQNLLTYLSTRNIQKCLSKRKHLKTKSKSYDK